MAKNTTDIQESKSEIQWLKERWYLFCIIAFISCTNIPLFWRIHTGKITICQGNGSDILKTTTIVIYIIKY